MPLISVIMSIYNEKLVWIKGAIESILSQSISDFEYIIIVDNPNLNVDVNDYITLIAEHDNRVKLIYNNVNLGLAKSLNIGLSYASGIYVARMDADDISMKNRFEKELEFLKINDADVVSCQRIQINEDDLEIGRSALSVRPAEITLPISNCICHPGAFMKRDSIVEIGGYRTFKKSQDYDLWLRLLTAKKKIMICLTSL